MKRFYLLVLFYLLVSAVGAQEISRLSTQNSDIILKDGDPTESLKYQKVIDFQGINQLDLFNYSQQWISELFRTCTVVNNRMINESSFTIIEKPVLGYFYHKIKANNSMMSRCTGNIVYTLKIECKEGKIRVTSTDYIHNSIEWNLMGQKKTYDMGRITVAEIKSPKWPNWMNKCWIDAKDQTAEVYNELISNITNYINNHKSDEW